MTEPDLKMGYVGCGFMAQHVHLPNFASIPGCQLIALAEVRPKLAEAVAHRFGIPKVYHNHLELAEDPEVTAAGVSAGFAQQAQVAEDLLRAGKHVFMEKPMALSIRWAQRLLEACQVGRSRLMVGYMKRYDPGNQAAREIIARWQGTGEMGRPLYARAHGFCGNWLLGLDADQMITSEEPTPVDPIEDHVPEWLPPEHATSYVSYLQQYTHNVNLLRFLLGSGQQVTVKAVDLDPDGYTGVVVLELGGVRAILESGSIDYHAWEEHTQIYFERGWVHVWSPPLFDKQACARLEVYAGGKKHSFCYPVPKDLGKWAYRQEAIHFVQAVRAGEPFLSSAEDTFTDVEIFEEIYRHYLGLPFVSPQGRDSTGRSE